jgi:hypothetical protein
MKIAMKQRISASYIKWGVLYPGKEFKINFPPINVPFTIVADNESIKVHMEKDNKIAFKNWSGWRKIKSGDVIVLRELIPKKKYILKHIPEIPERSLKNRTSQKQTRDDTYDKEQMKIVTTIKREVENLGTEGENKRKKTGWAKYKGNIAAQVLISYIKPYLKSKNLKIVGHDYFIHGWPTELDAMIIKKGAKPHPRFNTYETNDVKVVIEIKESGIYNFKKSIKKIKSDIKNMQDKNIKEIVVVIKTSQKKPIKRNLKNSSFVLFNNIDWKLNMDKWKDVVDSKINTGEWKRLVSFLNKL